MASAAGRRRHKFVYLCRGMKAAMAEWYRNERWDAAIEAAFDAKLARTRSQRSQYLRIQGSTLKDSDPAAALGLLRRCIGLGDPADVAAALLDSAHAHYRLGEVGEALSSLEAAMEQEARHPMFRTSAHFDYPMLVALHARTERYDIALALTEAPDGALLPVMDFQRDAARAVILASRGRMEEARMAAMRALEAEATPGWIPGHPHVGTVPGGDNPLSLRIREIAARPGRE